MSRQAMNVSFLALARRNSFLNNAHTLTLQQMPAIASIAPQIMFCIVNAYGNHKRLSNARFNKRRLCLAAGQQPSGFVRLPQSLHGTELVCDFLNIADNNCIASRSHIENFLRVYTPEFDVRKFSHAFPRLISGHPNDQP